MWRGRCLGACLSCRRGGDEGLAVMLTDINHNCIVTFDHRRAAPYTPKGTPPRPKLPFKPRVSFSDAALSPQHSTVCAPEHPITTWFSTNIPVSINAPVSVKRPLPYRPQVCLRDITGVLDEAAPSVNQEYYMIPFHRCNVVMSSIYVEVALRLTVVPETYRCFLTLRLMRRRFSGR